MPSSSNSSPLPSDAQRHVEALEASLRAAQALLDARGRWVSWPPTPPPPLDLTRLGRELTARDAQEEPVLAAVVAGRDLARAGAARGAMAPGLVGGEPVHEASRAWLARTAGLPDPAWPEGSLGALLADGALGGLEARAAETKLIIDWVAPIRSRSAGDRLAFAVTLARGEARWRAWAEVTHLDPVSLARAPAAGWRDRVAEVLAQIAGVASPEESVGALELERVLEAVAPVLREGTVAHWVITEGVARLAPSQRLLRATRGSSRFELSLVSVTPSPPAYPSELRATLRAASYWEDDLVELVERESLCAPFEADAYERDAPERLADADSAIEAWRAAATRLWDELADGLDAPGALFHSLEFGRAFVDAPLSLMARWLLDGPPGELPPKPAPRLPTDDARVEAVASRLRRIDGAELDALRADGLPQLAAAYAIDDWTVLLCPFHRTGGRPVFGEDQLALRAPDGSAIAIAVNDPWNGHVMPIDGDAELLRALCRLLRAAIAHRDLDVDYTRELREDELELLDDDELDALEDPPTVTTSVTDWLAFAPAHREPTLGPIDWRVDVPQRLDLVAGFDFWQSGPFGLDGAARDRYRAGIGAHYHPFLRTLGARIEDAGPASEPPDPAPPGSPTPT